MKGRSDLIAGLTVAAISFPQAIAYALIAGVDPKFGVYSAIVVTTVASIFGSSSHLINGPTSAISLLVFTALAFIDSENTTQLYEALFLLGVLVGAFQIVIAVFKLGNLTRYISESVKRVVRDRVPGDPDAPSIVIYDLEGELFFGAAPELGRHLTALAHRIDADDSKFVVLRLKRVRHPDVVCIERIDHFLRELTDRGVTVLLAGVRPDTLGVLKNVGLQSWFPEDHIFPEEDEEYSATLKAVRYAHAKRDAVGAEPVAAAEDPDFYYLV